MLGQQSVHQVTQNRHALQSEIGKIELVDQLHRPIYNGFLDSLQPSLVAHDKLTEGQHKMNFQCQKVFFLGVVEVDVQEVHIVGAGLCHRIS